MQWWRCCTAASKRSRKPAVVVVWCNAVSRSASWVQSGPNCNAGLLCYCACVAMLLCCLLSCPGIPTALRATRPPHPCCLPPHPPPCRPTRRRQPRQMQTLRSCSARPATLHGSPRRLALSLRPRRSTCRRQRRCGSTAQRCVGFLAFYSFCWWHGWPWFGSVQEDQGQAEVEHRFSICN